MQEKWALLVVGGESPPQHYLRFWAEVSGIIIAADSGLDHCTSAGVVPDFVVGDMDSVSDSARSGMPADVVVEAHDRAKDLTDTELGLEIAEREGAAHIVLCGGGGGRLDHLLAIYHIMYRRLSPIMWCTRDDELVRIDRYFSDVARTQHMLSYLPGSNELEISYSEGLRWSLDGLVWGSGSFGISNEGTGGRYAIELARGRLLQVRALREDPELTYRALVQSLESV